MGSTQARAAVYGRQSSNKAKSIGEQLDLGHRVVIAEGWKHAGDYQDGRSASRFATKPRGQWKEVVLAVQAGRFDILVLWESSRGDRTPEDWFAFLSSCRQTGTRIHVITHDRTYDLKNARDWKTLAEDGVNNAYEAELLSVRVRRGHAGAAAAGLPPGGVAPYGYKRTFDPGTGERLGQVISEPEAAVVREIFKRVSKNETIVSIARDLEGRLKDGSAWTPKRVRTIARNHAYVALRRLNGAEYQGVWKPIVPPKLFYAAQQVLHDPKRSTTRPGRQVHLLTYLARCAVCEERIDYSGGRYRCAGPKGCISAVESEMDDAVRTIVLARLTQPDAVKALAMADREGVENVNTLEDEIAKLKNDLNTWRLSAASGKTSPDSLAVIETGIAGQIQELENKARRMVLPPALVDLLERPEADVPKRWDAATVQARRSVLEAICDIRISKGKGGRRTAAQIRMSYLRLGNSRWHGDEKTWSDYWAS
jgi:site-specific DNA recombinase